MGAPAGDNRMPEPDHVWTCDGCKKRIVCFLSAIWPSETRRVEESKYHAEVAKHQMECSDV